MIRMTRVVLVALALCSAPLQAQIPVPEPGVPPASGTGVFGLPVTMQGEFSIFGEAYGISGRAPRRPGETGRILFQPTFQITRFLYVGMDFQLTTEGLVAGAGAQSPQLNAARQRLNQFGISPTWSWGRLNLGDFTDSYTPYTLSGVRLRGGGLMLNPGLLRFGFIHGSAQSAVVGMSTTTAFARTLAGGRIGVGRANGSYLDLIVIRGRDNPGSLPAVDDSAFYDPRLDDPTVDPDTLDVGTLINPLSVTPQDNLVAGASGRLQLLNGGLQLQGEFTGAAHTRDVRASALENEALLSEIPGFLRGVFTPRIGSTFGTAISTRADVRFGTFTGNATFRQVDPGYVSLGVASLLNDQRGWTLGGTQRFGRSTSLRLDFGSQRDNLTGQKNFTTTRERIGAMLALRPLPRLSSSLRLQYVGMRNGVASGEAQQIDYGNWIFGTTQTLALGRERRLRSVGLSYTYRDAGDANPLRASSRLSAHSTSLRATFAPSDVFSLTPSLGLVRTTSGLEEQTRVRKTYGIAGQARLYEGRWVSSASFGSTEDRGSTAFQTRVTSRFNLTDVSTVTFTFREGRFRNAPNPFGPPGGFRERAVTLQLTHQVGSGR